MWHLKNIKATNLCSFLELDFSPKQRVATLIFGNNLDSDSQNSNGSGKSALIEAIAIALTGEPLRKVNADEIINDSQNEATISAVLFNDTFGQQLTINRRLSRKQPQIIQVIKQVGPYDTDTEEISQATVADYNKYILDQIGLTKDDIFANFILTARKYKSFLASSDKEKKEIINRFSNGVLVDESIEALLADMEPVQTELTDAEKEVSLFTGRVDAMAAEIERTINESAENKRSREAKIKELEGYISDYRQGIREAKQNIADIEDSMDSLDMLDANMQELEKQEADIDETLDTIFKQFANNTLALETDFHEEIDSLNNELSAAQIEAREAAADATDLLKALQTDEVNYAKSRKEILDKQAENEKNRQECAERLDKLTAAVQRLRKKNDKLTGTQVETQKAVADIQNQLAGVIQCPKCKHEFVLSADLDIAAARKKVQELKDALDKCAKDIATTEKEYDKTVSDGKNQREIETDLETECRSLARQLDNAETAIEEARKKCARQERKLEQLNNRVSELQNKLSKIRKRIFDEVFEIIDAAYKNRESKIKGLESRIQTLEGSIQSFEEGIEAAQKATDEDLLASLKKSREEYQDGLKKAMDVKNEVEGRLNALKAQERTFIEFKTYLANTKINAIAQITNEFLATIGSDIRVALSGFTILKSGKVRDKISVTLLRDGVDCGSFEKFSAGERVRVELASILSMNQLTNLNCEEGKGLDLLVADEVLDSADEQGLASVFKALNQTQLTSLVVSHGQIHEGYPNKITVTKSNGVSSIHGNEQQTPT